MGVSSLSGTEKSYGVYEIHPGDTRISAQRGYQSGKVMVYNYFANKA
jgi:hypothetical protein